MNKRFGGLIYPVTIDYDDLNVRGRTNEGMLQLLVDLGHYNIVHERILSASFTVGGNGKKSVWLGLYDAPRFINRKELVVELNQQGLRPANHNECMLFGAQHLETQKGILKIHALGRVGYQNEHGCIVSIFCGEFQQRWLWLSECCGINGCGDWGENGIFLVGPQVGYLSEEL